MFELDPRLQNDTLYVGDFPLCRLLLMNDATYPWFILVPRRAGVSEVYQLSDADQCQLWRESARLGKWLAASFRFDKLNIGALGNVVSQLHIHHVGRSADDPSWPGPVWGQHPPRPYAPEQSERIVQQARNELAELLRE